MFNKLSNSSGVTLIEIMIAVLTFAIGISAILAVCVQGMTTARRTEAAYTAYNLAKNRIETLKSITFSDLASASETSTVLDASGVADLEGTFTRTTVITTNYNSDANLTQAKVTIYYTVKGTQSAAPLEMTTVIYRNA